MYIPGPITGFIGLPGSGKSFYALKLGLYLANKIEYDICFNFSINESALYEYCILNGYTWLCHRISRGKLICRESVDLQKFMPDRETRILYILDEAGVYLNARSFQDTPKTFLHSLAQIRHDSKLLFWCAQYYDQVDRIIRDLSASICLCNSITKYSASLGNLEIVGKKAFLFDSSSYKIYSTKVDGKVTGIKHLLAQKKLSLKCFFGPLDFEDKLLFATYNSFGERVGGDLQKKSSSKVNFFNKIKVSRGIQVNYSEQEFKSKYTFKSQAQINQNEQPTEIYSSPFG